MKTDFDYRSLTLTLAAGESRKFDALRFLALSSATAALQIAPRGKAGSFGPFLLYQCFENPESEAIGPVDIKNGQGVSVTFTVVTSNKRIRFADSGASQSVSVDAVSVTIPVSLASGAVGPAAHDAIATGNPVQVAGVAVTAERAAVAAGDVDQVATDTHGRPINLPFSNVAGRLSASVAIAAVGAVDLIAAQAAGVRVHLVDMLVSNEAATVNTLIVLDGAAELFRVTVPPNDSKPITFQIPVHTTAATALRINVTAATAMRVFASAYKGT